MHLLIRLSVAAPLIEDLREGIQVGDEDRRRRAGLRVRTCLHDRLLVREVLHDRWGVCVGAGGTRLRPKVEACAKCGGCWGAEGTVEPLAASEATTFSRPPWISFSIRRRMPMVSECLSRAVPTSFTTSNMPVSWDSMRCVRSFSSVSWPLTQSKVLAVSSQMFLSSVSHGEGSPFPKKIRSFGHLS